MAEEKVKPKLKYKIPKTVGSAIDLLMKVRTDRKVLTAKAEAEKQQENMIEEAIFNMFKKSDLEGARGKFAQASIKRSDVPTIEDFDKLWKWAVKNDGSDLFRRQVVAEAFRARLAAGVAVPGVEVFTKVGLHLTKPAK